MLKSVKEIKKINFDEIRSEEEFKNVMQMTDVEFDELMSYSQESTDENTPYGCIDVRITIDVLNEDDEEDILNFDLVYSYEEENDLVGDLNRVIAYY